jgi:hypothetical protein
VIGQCQSPELEPGGFLDKFLGIRGTIEKTEIRMAMELCVPNHGSRIVTSIEHVFAAHLPKRLTGGTFSQPPRWILSKLPAISTTM